MMWVNMLVGSWNFFELGCPRRVVGYGPALHVPPPTDVPSWAWDLVGQVRAFGCPWERVSQGRGLERLEQLLVACPLHEYRGEAPSHIDFDGVVGVLDLLVLLDLWGTGDEAGDINGDGVVGINDLLILIEQWGACE